MRCLLPPSFRHPSSFSRCSRFSVASSPSFGAAGDRKLEGKGGGGWCKTKDDSPLLRGKGGGGPTGLSSTQSGANSRRRRRKGGTKLPMGVRRTKERKKERGRRPCWLQNGERRKRRKQSTLHGEEWESLELLLLSYFSSSFWSSFHGPNYCSIGWVVWSSSDPNNFTPGFCGMLYLWFDRRKEITGGFRDSVPMHAKV